MTRNSTTFSSTNQPKTRHRKPKGAKHRIVSLREAFKEIATNHILLEEELKKLMHKDPKDFFKIMASLEPKQVEHEGKFVVENINISFGDD